ncbi:zinc finger protein 728-like [Physella acuta]|uniref:zinc finger protein 728-like n=1 Tax=Physella acuta TaxID=109671 RepID=UPI0027DBAE6E|nr:zinc finger protein 728-like [Physella acuta]XP_059173289.1 zinc finger protein 728-like [Physella acuta]
MEFENRENGGQEEISSLASLLRTFLPDDSDLPYAGSTELLLQHVGSSLIQSTKAEPQAASNGIYSSFSSQTSSTWFTEVTDPSCQKLKVIEDANSDLQQPSESDDDDSDATIDVSLTDTPKPVAKKRVTAGNKLKRSEPTNKVYACFVCDERFTDMSLYTPHMVSHCREALSIHCSDCNETFSSKAQYTCHRRLSTFEVWVDRSKIQDAEMVRPVEETTKSKGRRKGQLEEKYFCNICGKAVHKFPSFIKHVRAHRATTAFQCAVCQENFQAACLLRNHIDLQHSHVLPFQCRRCLRRFKMKSSLSTHLKYCDVEPGSLPFAEEMQFIDQLSQQRKYQEADSEESGLSQYSCPICTIMFDSPEELQKHMSYHDETKPYKCKECGRGFKSKRMLQKHSLLHKTGHDCRCEICGVQLITRSGYNAHLRGHRNQEIIQATFITESKPEAKVESPAEPALEILQRLKVQSEPKVADVSQSGGDEDPSLVKTPNHKPKNYPCPFCGLKFYSGGAKFQAHARKVHKEGDFIKCGLCSKSFLGKDNLERHVRLHKIYTQVFSCEECGKNFRRKYALLVHKKMHSFKKFVKCDICGQEFRFVSEVDKHKNTKHRYDKVLNIYKCNICGQRFPMLSHLSVHCHCHNLPDSKPFECDLCGISFKTSTELKQHIFKKHEELMKRLNDPNYSPDVEAFLMYSKNKGAGLNGVIKQEPIEMEENREDSNSHLSESSLTESKTLMETGGLNDEEMSHLPSNVDAYNLATRQFSHQAKILKRWSCEVCQKAFASNSDLKTHRRTHSGETPFKCDFCDRSFKQRGHRKLHIQVVHTRDMPFKCDLCESAFPTRYRYKVHLKRHAGLKEYRCLHCEKCYYTLGKLNEHKKKRHAVQWEAEQLHKSSDSDKV